MFLSEMKAFGLTKVCNQCKYREFTPDVSCGSGMFYPNETARFFVKIEICVGAGVATPTNLETRHETCNRSRTFFVKIRLSK